MSRAGLVNCVILDTNQWIRHKWLGSPIGSSLRDLIHQDDRFVLAIPEVLNLELAKHIGITARDLNRDWSKIANEIYTTTGEVAFTATVSPLDIENAIKARIEDLAESTIRPKLSLRQVRSALKRINDGSPPNGPKNQQAKDSLLWEACVDLSRQYAVLLVTGDGGFYRDRRVECGLAPDLASEGAVKSGRLKAFATIEALIDDAAPNYSADLPASDIPVIETALLAAIKPLIRVNFIALDAALSFHGARVKTFKLYRSGVEGARSLSVSFSLEFTVRQPDSDKEGRVTVAGEGRLDERSTKVSEIELDTIEWHLHSADGTPLTAIEIVGPRSYLDQS